MSKTLYSTMDACNTGITHMESRKLLSFHLFMISIFFFLIFLPSTTSLSFNFPTFDPNSHQIYLEGEARLSSDGCIQLPRSEQGGAVNVSWGRAMYTERLYLRDRVSRNLTDFTTNFSFVIDSLNNTNRGDGLTFFLNGTRLPSDGWGEGLGIMRDNNVINKSTAISFVAVEFDTYPNPGKEDPSYDHFGIDIISLISVETEHWASHMTKKKMHAKGRTYCIFLPSLSLLFFFLILYLFIYFSLSPPLFLISTIVGSQSPFFFPFFLLPSYPTTSMATFITINVTIDDITTVAPLLQHCFDMPPVSPSPCDYCHQDPHFHYRHPGFKVSTESNTTPPSRICLNTGHDETDTKYDTMH